MEDRKIAGILVCEFNKLSREEEVNREDKDWLAILRGRKLSICKVMDLLGVIDLIEFEHKTIAHLKSVTENAHTKGGR